MPILGDGTIAFESKHEKRCFDEATKDVIFLLQYRRVALTPDSRYEYDSDLESIVDYQNNPVDEDVLIGNGDAFVYWTTESVWLDRDEAESYGTSHAYHWGKGRKNTDWRVYGIHTEGMLSQVLRSSGQ